MDVDPAIMALGRRFFDLAEDERLRLHCLDGLQFLRDAAAAGRCSDVIIIDVATICEPGSSSGASRAVRQGLEAPPAAFLELEALDAASQCLT